MKTDLARRIAEAHGVLAWLAAASLVACAFIFVRRDKRRRFARGAALLAASLVALAFASGAMLDLPYRAHLRQRIFLASRALGWLFERKLHFSLGALAFACIALAAHLAAGKTPDDPAGKSLVRVSRAGFVASALFAIAACVASSIVAARLRF